MIVSDGIQLPKLTDQQYKLAESIGGDVSDEEIIELSKYYGFLKSKRCDKVDRNSK
jgi:hypothetical protein